MQFVNTLKDKLASKHLLNHPFYQAWTEGKLTLPMLQDYAEQYYKHVDAFPRYLSATHSNCETIEDRQVLLENLMDEERGSEHHPELWLRFAESVGANREGVKAAQVKPYTKNLVDTFMSLSRSSYAEGLGALYAYEHQVPAVAESKMKGLKDFYGIDSKRATDFFNVHLKADVYHSQAAADLMEKLPEADKKLALAAADKAASALWGFLDGQWAEIKNEVQSCGC